MLTKGIPGTAVPGLAVRDGFFVKVNFTRKESTKTPLVRGS